MAETGDAAGDEAAREWYREYLAAGGIGSSADMEHEEARDG